MSRRFFKPFFSLFEPWYIPIKKSPIGGPKTAKQYQRSKHQVEPNQTFDKFFSELYQNPEKLRKQEKQFFQKHYPEMTGEKFDPYKTLGVDKQSNLEQIKQAYRNSALKYHPKVDSTPQGKRQFHNLSRAYNQLMHQKTRDENGQDVSTQSLFQDFESQMEKFNEEEKQEKLEQNKMVSQGNPNTSPPSENLKKQNISAAGNQGSQSNQNLKENPEQKQSKSGETKKYESKQNKNINETKSSDKSQKTAKEGTVFKNAELYSQSSYFEFINGKRKLHVTKLYEKDGRKLRVDRIEGQLYDGSIQVQQTLDDGKQIKHRKYVKGSQKKDSSKTKAIGNK